MVSRSRFAVMLWLALLASLDVAASVRITGRVLSPGGSPFAEAQVQLVPWADPLQELADRNAGREQAEPIRTITDSKGRFELLASHAGMWRVRVEAEGFAPLELELRPLIEPVVLEDARLSPDVGFTLSVVGPDGTPAEGAEVTVKSERRRFGPRFGAWHTAVRRGSTAEDGVLRLPHAERDSLDVGVLAAGYPLLTLDGCRGTTAHLRLVQGADRALAIVSPDGKAVGGVLVALGAEPQVVGVSDEAGKLRVSLEPGSVIEVSALHPDGRRVASRIGPPPENPDESLRLVLPVQLSLVGRLIDADTRRPVADGVVWDLGGSEQAALSDAAGGFVLSGPAGQRLELSAGASGYLAADPFRFQLDDDGRPGPTLALRPAAAVSGVVVDGDDRPVAGAQVELSARRAPGLMRIEIGRPSTASRGLTDSQGTFRIGSIDPDRTYDLEVHAEGFAPSTTSLGDLEPYTTRSGLRVVLGRGHRATGVVADADGAPIAEVVLKLSPAAPSGSVGMMRIVEAGGDDSAIEVTSDEDGRFEFDGLPPGRFDLKTERRGFAKKIVPGIEIPDSDEPVDLGQVVLSPGETIQGFVRDAGDRPIEGVEVYVHEGGGGGMMMVMAGPGGGGETEQPDAVTDPTGWFAVGDLGRDERCSLELRRTGYVTARAAAVEIPQAEPLQIRMEAASDVSGTVTDSSGEPIAGARVNLERTRTMEMGGRAMAMMMMTDATTDQEGRFLFEDQEPGTISLSAVATGYQQARRDDLEVPRGADLDDVRIPLPAGAILEGRVLTPDGRAAIGASVGPVGKSEGLGGMARQLNRVGVDGNGYYRIEGLEPGPISIEAEHPDFPRVVRDAEVREGRNTLDLSFRGGQEVSGRVIDTTGGVVADAVVRLVPAGRSWGGPQTTSSADGSFSIPGVQDGDYTVLADAEGYAAFVGPLSVTVSGQPVDGLEVQMDAGGTILGRISGLEPARFAEVEVTTEGPGPAGFGGASVDYEGNYRIDHLAAGDYTVTARLQDSGRQASAHGTLEAGATELRVDLQFGAGITLSGVALQGDEPVVGATVFAEGLDVDHTGWSQTDTSGHFSIEGIQPGSYEVHVRNFQTGLAFSQQFDLASSREVRLVLPTAMVEGRVLDAADREPLSGVTVALVEPQAAGHATLPTHTTTTDLDGHFRLSSVADGQWQLMASRKGYAATSIPVAVQFDRPVDDLQVLLDPTEGLTLEVHLPSGAAPDALNVAVLDAGGSPLVSGSFTTGENGRVRLTSVPAGHWELILSAAGAAASEVAVQAPGPPVALQLQPATVLRVEVPELVGTADLATVSLQNADGRPFRTLSWTSQPRSQWRMEGGQSEFIALPPGTWTVAVNAADGRQWTGTASTSAQAPSLLTLD